MQGYSLTPVRLYSLKSVFLYTNKIVLQISLLLLFCLFWLYFIFVLYTLTSHRSFSCLPTVSVASARHMTLSSCTLFAISLIIHRGEPSVNLCFWNSQTPVCLTVYIYTGCSLRPAPIIFLINWSPCLNRSWPRSTAGRQKCSHLSNVHINQPPPLALLDFHAVTYGVQFDRAYSCAHKRKI